MDQRMRSILPIENVTCVNLCNVRRTARREEASPEPGWLRTMLALT